MYTPSAYTLTNTTRPHELNAKKIRAADSWMDGARWNWYSRRGAINSSQLHNRRQNHRQMHTQSSKRRKERVARSAPRADDPARFASSDRSRAVGRLAAISANHVTRWNQSCPGSRACNPARSHTSPYTGCTMDPLRLSNPRQPSYEPTPLRGHPAHAHLHTYTRTFDYTFDTLSYTSWIHLITHATDM